MYQDEIERILNSSNQAFELTKYINDDIFMNDFVEYTKPAFLEAKYNSLIDSKTEKIIFMAFTFVALKHYDGKIWEHIYRYYETSELTAKDIYTKVRINVFSQWVKGYHCDTSKREQTYQIPVIESIIPFNYAAKYIDFVFDIYEKCFQYSLENVDEELELFFNATRELLQDDDGKSDTFESKDNDGSSKTYILIQGTKRILKYANFKNKVKQLKEFTKQFLVRIDNYYIQQGSPEPNYYFDKSFEEWTKLHPEVKIKKNTGTREVYLRNRKPRFILDTNTGKVYLRTPMLHISKKEEPSKIKIYVYSDGKEIYSGNPHITDMLSLIEICYKEVEIEDPTKLISCKITYEDEVLYSSDEQLYRNNIFFNDEKEVKPNSNYNGNLYVVCKKDTLGFRFVRSLPKYMIYSLMVSEDNYAFVIDGNHYSFKGSYDSEIYGDFCKEIVFQNDNSEVALYRKIKHMVLTSNNKSIKANYIKINDLILKEDSFLVKEQKSNIAYILDVDKIFVENGYYDIRLIDKSNNHIVDEYCLVLDSAFYMEQSIDNDSKVLCSICSSYSIVDEDNNEISSFNEELQSFEDKMLFLSVNEIKYEFKLKLTIPYYVIDSGSKTLFGTELTYNKIDLNSIIYFYNTKEHCRLLYDGGTRNLLIKTKDGRKYIELSELKNHEESIKMRLSFLNYFGDEEVIDIYTKPCLDSDLSNIYLDCINQKLLITPMIHGFDTIPTLCVKIFVADELFDFKSISANHATISTDLDSKKANINIQIGYTIEEIDFESGTFDVISKFIPIYSDDYRYTPLASLVDNSLYVKYIVPSTESAEPETVRPPMFLKMLEKHTDNSYLCEAYHDNSLSFKASIGVLLVEFEPIYIAETNNKRRLNATIYLYDKDKLSALYYDCGKISVEESKWSDPIDYFVIEEDIPW